MSDFFDYLKWRGDLSFSDIKPCAVDAAIFAISSYIDLGALCGDGITQLRLAAGEYCADGRFESVDLGLMMPSENTNKLFKLASETYRFGNARISDFVAQTSVEHEYQFAAVTFHLPGKQMMISFRGTDDTIVGWKEDCCLSFMDEIPAQRMAVEYLERVAESYPEERIYITGHSKGGNLAVYSAVKCPEATKKRISKAFCFDGPGLSYSTVNSKEFKSMQRKLAVLLPQSSFIGIMFEKGEKYQVVKSRGRGLYQHDMLTWELDGPAFMCLPELSGKGKKNELQFKSGMQNMTSDEKRSLVGTVFAVLESTGAKTLTDLSEGTVKKLISAVKAYNGLDKTRRELTVKLLLKLFAGKKE